jgi:hypothetical protein
MDKRMIFAVAISVAVLACSSIVLINTKMTAIGVEH